MGRVLGAEIVPLDAALEALALAGATHVDPLTGLEHVGLDLGTDLGHVAVVVFEAELPESATGLDTGLGEVSGLRLVQARALLAADRYLYGSVAIGVVGADLGHAVWLDLDNGDRDRGTVVGEDPCHACFAAYNSNRHLSVLSSA